jgi:hypothetical protein
LILCALMNLTISAPSINLSISMSFRILRTLSILTGPNIFLNICLSKMHTLFLSFAIKVQVSGEYVMTGLIYPVSVLVFFLKVFVTCSAHCKLKSVFLITSSQQMCEL